MDEPRLPGTPLQRVDAPLILLRLHLENETSPYRILLR